MANEEHLAILRQGVEVWNRWREEHPDIVPNLQQAELFEASLVGINLLNADLKWTLLSLANLTNANLFRANLQGIFLDGANLQGANFVGAYFFDADLENTNMRRARVGMTTFAWVDLHTVQGLDTVQHDGPSTIGIDTLYRSQGNIPESFLRGCGVPDSMIEYARSLVAAERPIDYYSCFISYSSTDQAIAERLYADLQAKGCAAGWHHKI